VPFLKLKSISRHPVLLVGFAVLLLFVVGPERGSVDADGDGIPETPVVILSAISAVGTGTSKYELPSELSTRGVPYQIAIPNRTYIFKSELKIPFPVGRSALRSFCLLRC
jgi:hypothetical protein